MKYFVLPFLFQDRIKIKYIYQGKEIIPTEKFFADNPSAKDEFPSENQINRKRLEVIKIAKQNNIRYELIISEKGFELITIN